ncbi:MAG: hypothetical protein EA381_12150 [Planctomycetaceae bacterium]|nr:MAG: hypothetical protein EA381_12150 [Planctomycetaceae bacterium]
MTKTIPAYLRLHSGPTRESTISPAAPLDPVSHFWQAYVVATGWRVDAAHTNGRANQPAISADEIEVLQAPSDNLPLDPSAIWDIPAVSRGAAQRLAAAGIDLTRQLQASLAVIRRQEAELAASAALGDVTDDSGALADRLEGMLQRAAAATGCDVAALYLLDDDTTSLKLRACSGLPATRLVAPARPLRGSRGDLESLVRDVVLIEDLEGNTVGSWNSPESFPSAIVVRIELEDLPVGTLWLWSERASEFSSRDGAAARLAATAIAAELTRTKLARQRHRWCDTQRSIQAAAQWQLRQLPPAVEIAPKVIVDGWTESPRPWACSWHAWDVLPDGVIALALAEAEPTGMDGAMIAATSRAAYAAHGNYRHSVTDMLSRISDSLWQTNSGDQIVSMLYGHLNPETGEGRIASAGNIQAIIASSRGFRPLRSGSQSDPLGSRIDGRFSDSEFRLHPGEVLVAVNAGVLDPETGLSQAGWADCVRHSLTQSDVPVLSAIRRALAGKTTTRERAGLMLLRKG